MDHQDKNHFNLALQATSHCLLGCGIGDVAGFAIGTIVNLNYTTSIIVGIVAGFVLGYIFGIYPLLKSKISFGQAFKIILTTETISIIVMETAETIIELIFLGMKKSGIFKINYSVGLSTALLFGFIAAFPANYFLVKRGVRHHH